MEWNSLQENMVRHTSKSVFLSELQKRVLQMSHPLYSPPSLLLALLVIALRIAVLVCLLVLFFSRAAFLFCFHVLFVSQSQGVYSFFNPIVYAL